MDPSEPIPQPPAVVAAAPRSCDVTENDVGPPTPAKPKPSSPGWFDVEVAPPRTTPTRSSSTPVSSDGPASRACSHVAAQDDYEPEVWVVDVGAQSKSDPPASVAAAQRRSHHSKKNDAFVNNEDITEFDFLDLSTAAAFNHPGKKRLRELLQEFTPKYYRANNRAHEKEICQELVGQFRNSGGRFLKPAIKVPKTTTVRPQKWKIIKDSELMAKVERAMQKACQRMLDRRAMSRAYLRGTMKRRIRREEVVIPKTRTNNPAVLAGLKTPPAQMTRTNLGQSAAPQNDSDTQQKDPSIEEPVLKEETKTSSGVLQPHPSAQATLSASRTNGGEDGEPCDAVELHLRDTLNREGLLAPPAALAPPDETSRPTDGQNDSIGMLLATARARMAKPENRLQTDEQNDSIGIFLAVARARMAKPENTVSTDEQNGPKSIGILFPARRGKYRMTSSLEVARAKPTKTLTLSSIIARSPMLQHRNIPYTKVQEEAAKAIVLAAKGEMADECSDELRWNTPLGRALYFSKALLAIDAQLTKKHSFVAHLFSPVAKDHIVSWVERLLGKQSEFRDAKKPFRVDLGYHYTRHEHLNQIRNFGLVTREELKKLGIQVKLNGNAMGDGIYTSNNPHVYLGRYGNAGLLTLRLRGRERVHSKGLADEEGVDTLINHPGAGETSVLLKSGAQCVPFILFDSSDMRRFANGKECLVAKALMEYHLCVKRLIENLFNKDCLAEESKLSVPRTLAVSVRKRKRGGPGLLESSTPAKRTRVSGAAAKADNQPSSYPGISGALDKSVEPDLSPLTHSVPGQEAALPKEVGRYDVEFAKVQGQEGQSARQARGSPSNQPLVSFNRSAKPDLSPLTQSVSGQEAALSKEVGWYDVDFAEVQGQEGQSARQAMGSTSNQPLLTSTVADEQGNITGLIDSKPAAKETESGVTAKVSTRSDSFPDGSSVVDTKQSSEHATRKCPYACSLQRLRVMPASRRSQRRLTAALDPNERSSTVSVVSYIMPDTMREAEVLPENVYTIVTPSKTSDCAICMNLLHGSTDSTVRLSCGHEHHLECLRTAAKRKAQCPICRQPFQQETPVGQMPSGNMIVRRDPRVACEGYPSGCLIIRYKFPSGVQKDYHPNPNHRYSGTTRTAYLPDTEEGQQLLWRLKKAFEHGLTFQIGQSLTTGRQNVITWVSIPHKTSPSGNGNPHGFPDPLYFRNCNDALDALHVERPNAPRPDRLET